MILERLLKEENVDNKSGNSIVLAFFAIWAYPVGNSGSGYAVLSHKAVNRASILNVRTNNLSSGFVWYSSHMFFPSSDIIICQAEVLQTHCPNTWQVLVLLYHFATFNSLLFGNFPPYFLYATWLRLCEKPIRAYRQKISLPSASTFLPLISAFVLKAFTRRYMKNLSHKSNAKNGFEICRLRIHCIVILLYSSILLNNRALQNCIPSSSK